MRSDIQVKDLVMPFKECNAQTSVADALKDLDSSGVEYGVVKDAQGELLALVHTDMLRSFSDTEDNLSSVVGGEARPLVVEPGDTIDKTVENLASHFAVNPELLGVVVADNNTLKGVLPRKAVIKRALQIVASRGADRLEGAPLDTVYFECLLDNERKAVDYYDPANPPVCAKGHKMIFVDN